MSDEGVEGMRAAVDDLSTIVAELTAEQWGAMSAATGWTVKDVVVHIGSLLELLQAAVGGAAVPQTGIERLNEQTVVERRGWTSKQAADFLDDQCRSALKTFGALQAEPLASTPVPMLDLGVYPLHAVADMFSFDITTHLRYDILAPQGPIQLEVPPLDERRLVPAVSWLVGGLEQMQPDLARHLRGPIRLVLDGPGGRRLVIRADAHGGVSARELRDSDFQYAATVVSTTADFLGWSTRRKPWASAVQIAGDRLVAESFLDAVNLI